MRPKCPEELLKPMGSVQSCHRRVCQPWRFPTLVAMLSHPTLLQACISVYIAVYCVYLFLDKRVHLQPLPEKV